MSAENLASISVPTTTYSQIDAPINPRGPAKHDALHSTGYRAWWI